MGLASIRLKRGRALLPLGLKPEFAILVGMDEGQVNANLWDIPQGQQYMELSSNIKLLLNLVCVSVCLCVHAMACVWRSEDNSWSGFSLVTWWDLDTEFWSSDLCQIASTHKCHYPLSRS